MALKVTKVSVWAASIQDQPGGLAVKLRALADAGANLEFVIARRAPDRPGQGVVFVTPLKGARQTRAAAAMGFGITNSLHSLRVQGADQPSDSVEGFVPGHRARRALLVQRVGQQRRGRPVPGGQACPAGEDHAVEVVAEARLVGPQRDAHRALTPRAAR
jgi:hypothetical protein